MALDNCQRVEISSAVAKACVLRHYQALAATMRKKVFYKGYFGQNKGL